MKWWADTNRWPALGGGLALYAVSLLIVAVLLRRVELGFLFALWVGVAAVLVTLVGWWLFGEVLSPRHIVGIGLVIAGILALGT